MDEPVVLNEEAGKENEQTADRLAQLVANG